MPVKTNLYGGAITADFPIGFIDASQFREIPDTQEVYVSETVDDSLVIDLMEAVEEIGDEAVNTHLKEIAEMNNAGIHEYARLYTAEHKVTTLSEMSHTPAAPSSAVITVAIEPARKWGRSSQLHSDESEKDEKDAFEKDNNNGLLESPLLALVLAVVRLHKVSTDLVVTYNVPITQRKDLEGLRSGQPEQMPERVQAGLESVRKILESLEVHDWQLFG